jgi:ribosomal protein S12
VRVPDEQAREAAKKPRKFRGHEVVYGECIVIYDDAIEAHALAQELGTEIKTAANKHPDSAWQTMYRVQLPSNWQDMV